MEEFFERNCWIRGYHIYEEVQETVVGESLVCKESPKTLPINTLLVRAMACDGEHYGSHCNVSTIRCRIKIGCGKHFVRLNFVHVYDYENFPTMKISRFRVVPTSN